MSGFARDFWQPTLIRDSVMAKQGALTRCAAIVFAPAGFGSITSHPIVALKLYKASKSLNVLAKFNPIYSCSCLKYLV
jgi:hypothetical protein